MTDKKIKAILWDVDGTLLDFHASERAAIRTLFQEFHLGVCTEEMILRYSGINDDLWKRLEREEVSKKEVLIGRFETFFKELGLDPSIASDFNEQYQLSLGDTIVFRDDSYRIVESLKGKVKQYAVSNGTIVAQTKKLRLSGLGELMDGVFLSEDLGVEKPNIGFFEKVFQNIPGFAKEEIMIVGDSLTSDILGGNNAGIITCWYNPAHLPADSRYKIDVEIDNLQKVYQLPLGSDS